MRILFRQRGRDGQVVELMELDPSTLRQSGDALVQKIDFGQGNGEETWYTFRPGDLEFSE